MKKAHVLLFLILAIGFLLRFYKLGTIPALNADEAAIGYNAYSLIKTGLDEHGNPWPIHFQSFNDWKPGGFFYIVLPFVYMMDLNILSVRLPGAIMGILTVYILYALVKHLAKKESPALFGALLLAISPWHIHFSRGGWEVNAATLFISLGVYFFLKGLKNNLNLVYSVLFFALSLYTYHAARVIAPLLGLGLVLLYRDMIFDKKNRKTISAIIVLAALVTIPIVISFFGESGGARASGVSVFSDRGYIDRINENRGRYADPDGVIPKMLHNKPKEIAIEFSKNYFEHYWGEFLFLSGDSIERNKVPETGLLYMIQLPLLALGLVYAIRKHKKWNIVLYWLAIAPLPAALTFQSPHALRAQNMVIPLTIISALGFWRLVSLMRQRSFYKWFAKISLTLILVTLLWEFSRYTHQYYVHMAKSYPYSSQYGVEELVKFIAGEYDNYNKFVITTRYDQPYILFLFYTKYPPESFQVGHELTDNDNFGFSTVPGYDKFVFKPIEYTKDRASFPDSLIIGSDDEIPDSDEVVGIYGANGFLYFQAIENLW